MNSEDLVRFDPRVVPDSEHGNAYMVRSNSGDYVLHTSAILSGEF